MHNNCIVYNDDDSDDSDGKNEGNREIIRFEWKSSTFLH